MGFKHVTLRHRLFHAVAHEAADSKHRHLHEYIHEGLFVVANMMFLIGSICFFEGVGFEMWVYKLGDWLFIIAALMQLLLVAQSLREQMLAKKHLTSKFNEHDRHEILETQLFLVACAVFFVGSVLFMPGMYTTTEQERIGKEIGAWSFVTGSMGLVGASYYNALGIAAQRARQPEAHSKEAIVYALNCSALWLTQLGGVAFACGSFLYRPAFQKKCKDEEDSFDSAMNNGTILYILGSLIFLIQSIMSLIAGVLKHDEEESSSDDIEDTLRHSKVASTQKRCSVQVVSREYGSMHRQPSH